MKVVKTHLVLGALLLVSFSASSEAQKLRARVYGNMDLEADIPLDHPTIYHGISYAGCAQAVTLANNRSLTPVWQHQVDDGWGCGACVEEWKLMPQEAPIDASEKLFLVVNPKTGVRNWLSHDFSQDPPHRFKSGLRVYPTCIGAKGWGVWHSAAAEQ
jgi:hypothetical protein